MSEAAGAYNLLKVLSDVSEDHARVIRSLGKTLNRLSKDIENDQLQARVLAHIRKLRLLRSRLRRALDDGPRIDAVEGEARENILTLTEYMLLVGFHLERDMLKRALKLASKGARLIEAQRRQIEEDLEEIERLSSAFQELLGEEPPF